MSVFTRLTLSSGKKWIDAQTDVTPQTTPNPKDVAAETQGEVEVVRRLQYDGPTRGRPAKAKVRLVTAADVERVKSLEERYAPNTKAQQRVLTQYEKFLALNEGHGQRVGLREYVGTLLYDGLAISSVDTYVGYIVAKYKSTENRLLQKTIQRAHADQDCGAAPAVPREKLVLIVAKIRNERWRRMCYLLLLTGARPVTLQNAKKLAFTLHGEEYSFGFEVRTDKTHTSRTERDYLVVPTEMVPEGMRSAEWLESLWNFPEERPFEQVSVTTLNKVLVQASKGIVDVAPTTYSFRKGYIRELMRRYAPDGDVRKIMKYTLHTDVRCLKAHYVDYKELYGTRPAASDDKDEL